MNYNFCALFDKKFLTRGLSLYNSLAENCESDFRFFALCLDEDSYEILNSLGKKNITLIKLASIENGDLRNVRRDRSMAEYSWTLKPYLPQYIFDNYENVEVLSYLDSDLFFYSSPKPILDELGFGSVLLTPHNIPREKIKQEEDYGKYNAGFIAFRNDTEGRRCLEWWRSKCLEWCFDQIEPQRQGDQKYLNYFEGMFSGVVSSKNKGLNLAIWNIKNYGHMIKKIGEEVYVGENKLVFFHFAKFQLYYPPTFILPDSPYDFYSIPSPARKLIYKSYPKAIYRSVKEIQTVVPDFKEGFKPRPSLYLQIKNNVLPLFKTHIRLLIKKLSP